MSAVNIAPMKAEKARSLMACRIEQFHHALEELRRLTGTLFNTVPADEAVSDRWMDDEGFGVDDDGFFCRLPLQKLYRAGDAPPDAISYFWPKKRAEHPITRFRMYALRGIGPHLADLLDELPGQEGLIAYYQDVSNAVVSHPYVDPQGIVPPDFDWKEYFPYRTAGPDANPERSIQWALPEENYAEQDPFGIVSCPVYDDDEFMGIWSIDVPWRILLADCLPGSEETLHDAFVADRQGRIIHPREWDGEKQRIQWPTIDDRGYGDLNLRELFESGDGQVTIDTDGGEEVTFSYRIVPETGWIVFIPCSRTERDYDEYRQLVGSLIQAYSSLTQTVESYRQQRQRVKQALRDTEARHRALIEGIPAITYRARLDEASTTEFVSPQIEQMLGFTPEDYKNNPDIWRQRLHPEDREPVMDEVAKTHENQEPFLCEYRMIAPDGDTVWFRDHARVVEDPEGNPKYLLGIMYDITREKEAQQRVEEYQEKLRAMTAELSLAEERERRRIAEQLHDELGQVLSLARIKTSSICAGAQSETVQHSAEHIRRSLDESLDFVRNLTYQLSSPILSEMGLVPALEQLIGEIGKEYEPDIDFHNDDRKKSLGNAGELTLYRAVKELVHNAVKHASASRISVSVERTDNSVLVRVADDGEGCDPEVLEDHPSPSGGFGLLNVRERLNLTYPP